MTYHGVKIAALLELYRPSIVHVSTAMLEAELTRLGIKFKSRPFSNIIREYELGGVVDDYVEHTKKSTQSSVQNSANLKVYSDEDLRLVYQGIISDGKTAACVEVVKTKDARISYFPDDVQCTERKDCLIYRPCLMHDTLKPVFIKDLFEQHQIMISLPEPVHIVNAIDLLGADTCFVLLESEAEEFKKLFHSKRSD